LPEMPKLPKIAKIEHNFNADLSGPMSSKISVLMFFNYPFWQFRRFWQFI